MKITMVMVLYRQKPDESKTLQTLKRTLLNKNLIFNEIELVLYDNSPDKQEFIPLNNEGINVSYIHDSRNLGISSAYNFAWSQAKKSGSQWLLLLDHDTELTDEYLNEVLNLPDLTNSKDIVAVVPKIISENTMISPVYSDTLRPLIHERPNIGIQGQPVMAINSGTLVKISFLNDLNGFNNEFQLDYLDHWLFFKIYEKGKKAFVLDVTLEHELSVMDYSRVSNNRYRSILDSEYNFYRNYKKELYPSYRIQLAKRFLKQVLIVKNKRIAMYTLKKLFSFL